ncbi:MAG: hypothetical protein HY567_04565 [Candidatus Kerfeldbacteria bacterium]|nr:hypothetical protein [Candidatus Kerfeldbacteria bacterium]
METMFDTSSGEKFGASATDGTSTMTEAELGRHHQDVLARLCTNERWLQGLDGNHMVGMSALGALRSVVNQNLTYDAVLRYYYTGVSLIRAYE